MSKAKKKSKFILHKKWKENNKKNDNQKFGGEQMKMRGTWTMMINSNDNSNNNVNSNNDSK